MKLTPIDESTLKLIIFISDDKPRGILKTVYEKPDGRYIIKIEYKGQTKWIELGYTVVFYDEELDWRFQEAFHVSTAIKYGYKVPCNFTERIDNYTNLTCDPTTLIFKELISEDGAIGCYYKEEIYVCPNCKQEWRILENYDTQKGTWRNCNKV